MKYTTTNLKKLETILEELAYTVRYEKGNFQSGYCVVQDKKVVVVNKFYDTEGRINCLLDMLGALEVDAAQLSEKSAKLFQDIIQQKEVDVEKEPAEG